MRKLRHRIFKLLCSSFKTRSYEELFGKYSFFSGLQGHVGITDFLSLHILGPQIQLESWL